VEIRVRKCCKATIRDQLNEIPQTQTTT
jgi:hypothetical protein